MVLCQASENSAGNDTIGRKVCVTENDLGVNEGIHSKNIKNLSGVGGKISTFFVHHIYIVLKKLYFLIFYIFYR